eukprot:4519012-Prymnesium_polylepis.2
MSSYSVAAAAQRKQRRWRTVAGSEWYCRPPRRCVSGSARLRTALDSASCWPASSRWSVAVRARRAASWHVARGIANACRAGRVASDERPHIVSSVASR